MKVVNSTTITHHGGIKLAIHGAAGMGKTMLAATAPNPVVILTERTGADSLSAENIKKVFTGKKNIHWNGVDCVPAYTADEFEKAVNYVIDQTDYDTVIFDSMSEASKLMLKKFKLVCKNPMQAYGMMQDKIDSLLRYLRDGNMNAVCLFHSKRIVDRSEDEEGEILYAPGFEGRALTDEFPYLYGDVLCMVNEFDDEGNESRFLRTRQGDTNRFAKCRSGKLKELEEPHLGQIFAKLKRKPKTKTK